ncbi:MAG TPA: TonB family protein [Terracidiphilus sp.]|jgi:TonB family protein
MSTNGYPIRADFGLLPEPQKSPASFVTSAAINLSILGALLYVGITTKRVMETHKYEQTELIFPTTPPPAPMKLKIPPPPKIEQPKMPEVKLEAPKIHVPKPEPKPEVKPIQMEAKVALPVVKQAKPAIILAPQPKAALTAAAPAQVAQAHPSTTPVHLGETFGVTPNPNATRPATVAAIGNPYGGMNGPAVAPRGVVGSAGIGNGTKSGSNAGVVGHVASAGIPGATGTGTGNTYGGGKVASAGIPAVQQAATVTPAPNAVPKSTNLEVLSKPAVQYTAEARQLRVQGDVVLRVTFTAAGQVIIQGVVHGLGHGLDEEARRVAQLIRFRPATRNGQAVDLTTNITITFQLA